MYSLYQMLLLLSAMAPSKQKNRFRWKIIRSPNDTTAWSGATLDPKFGDRWIWSKPHVSENTMNQRFLLVNPKYIQI